MSWLVVVLVLGSHAVAAPARVVSLNVCTDQLAMLVAAPGQLVAVSHLAREPQSSAMAKAARAYPMTTGQAEDVFWLRPDLVLAGAYTTAVTVHLLQRLGVRVERFGSATRLDAIAADLRRMGALLGRESRAEALAEVVERRLAAIRAAAIGMVAIRASGKGDGSVRAAYLEANSYTAGTGTLLHAMVEAAGLRNVAADLGLAQTARLPLEVLALAHPDLLLLSERYGAPSQGEAVLHHPAVQALASQSHRVEIANAATICATPATVTAVERLMAARQALAAAPGRRDD